MNNQCEYYKNGVCKKTWYKAPCEPSGDSWFDYRESVQVIEKDQMCQNASIYGNRFVVVTPEDVQALKDGKVLTYDDGEYATFIKLEDE